MTCGLEPRIKIAKDLAKSNTATVDLNLTGVLLVTPNIHITFSFKRRTTVIYDANVVTTSILCIPT